MSDMISIRQDEMGGWLKAVGLLSILTRAKPADADAPTIRWRGPYAHIAVGFAAVDAIMDCYRPSIILSPWTSTTKAADVVIGQIMAGHARFGSVWQNSIATTQELQQRAKAEKWDKSRLVRELRNAWPDEALAWIDTVMPLHQNSEQTAPEPHFAGIGISGGNDGRWEVANNYLVALGEVIPGLTQDRRIRLSRDRLMCALGLIGQFSDVLSEGSIGPFGLTNRAQESWEPGPEALRNPWDMVLVAEGILAYQANHAVLSWQQSPVAPWCTRWEPMDTGMVFATEPTHHQVVWTPEPTEPHTWADLLTLMSRQTPDETFALQRMTQGDQLPPATCWVFAQRRGKAHMAIPALRE